MVSYTLKLKNAKAEREKNLKSEKKFLKISLTVIDTFKLEANLYGFCEL
jgi:hypothetical protein